MVGFLDPGVVHGLRVRGKGRGGDFVRVCGFFVMIGVGVIVDIGGVP
jgi:hypothetical protein